VKAKFSPLVQNEIRKIQKREKSLALRIEKQIDLFEENPKHPSLRVHKLSGTISNMWSISITKGIRMAYILIDTKTALFIRIVTHDEVYKK
jgi:addiction module RelE/StbE family toxin